MSPYIGNKYLIIVNNHEMIVYTADTEERVCAIPAHAAIAIDEIAARIIELKELAKEIAA